MHFFKSRQILSALFLVLSHPGDAGASPAAPATSLEKIPAPPQAKKVIVSARTQDGSIPQKCSLSKKVSLLSYTDFETIYSIGNPARCCKAVCEGKGLTWHGGKQGTQLMSYTSTPDTSEEKCVCIHSPPAT